MNTQDYILAAFRKLTDTSFYQSQDNDITLNISYDISKTLLNIIANKVICKKCLSYFQSYNPRPRRFFSSRKYTKIFYRLLRQKRGTLFLFTTKHRTSPSRDLVGDVTSLYTNIPLHEADRAIGHMLFHSQPHAKATYQPIVTQTVIPCFPRKHFHFLRWKKVTLLPSNRFSMGSKCAPSVTFIGDFERTLIDNLPNDQPKSLIWLKFIHDIFAIWTRGSTSLVQINSWLNSRHTASNSHALIQWHQWLCLTPVKLNCGLLETEFYIKPTSLSYLHRPSSHPTHILQSLPWGKFLRVRRNCTHLDSFDHFAEIILQAFIEWGYGHASLIRARHQARSKDRSSLLAPHANLQTHNTITTDLSRAPKEEFFLILEDHGETANLPTCERWLGYPGYLGHH